MGSRRDPIEEKRNRKQAESFRSFDEFLEWMRSTLVGRNRPKEAVDAPRPD